MHRAVQQLNDWAKALKRQVMVLWFCCRHRETPWLAKAVAIVVVAYALSPIDLIPDFIPILGYLDDLLLLPLGILLVIRLIPEKILAACRQQASAWASTQQPRPVNRAAAVLIVLIWLAGFALAWLAIGAH